MKTANLSIFFITSYFSIKKVIKITKHFGTASTGIKPKKCFRAFPGMNEVTLLI